jgi:hypothetical protein
VRFVDGGMRVYGSYWDFGAVLLDITDPSAPSYLSRADIAPPDEDGDVHSLTRAILSLAGSCCSAPRRMRDSNPRGVAPNTLSNGAQHRPEQAATVHDLLFCRLAARGGRR